MKNQARKKNQVCELKKFEMPGQSLKREKTAFKF
jgi:hypothetical protein